jgi:hypothetical protein
MKKLPGTLSRRSLNKKLLLVSAGVISFLSGYGEPHHLEKIY